MSAEGPSGTTVEVVLDGAVEVISPHDPDGLGYRNRARFTVATEGGHPAAPASASAWPATRSS